MKLTLGISPCPNDTFIFDALLNGKIDTEGLDFDYVLEDVETLNKMALSETLDITKISYGVLNKLLPNYRVLDSGGALGKGVGPLFISKKLKTISDLDQAVHSVILPGMYTTAHLLFTIAFPEIKKKIFLPFDKIEEALLNGEADTAVIIHENRFTYETKGLSKLADLGDLWESKTGLPIPLGGILVRRNFELALMKKINKIIQKSIAYANKNSNKLQPFVIENAQEMEEVIMRKHINLYVNEFSVDLGIAGRNAVMKLLSASALLNPISHKENLEIFID